ncbi:MAG: DNA recombination/repair protein RecA, partial [Clostridia bacterium]|nr:DNA recombination/repair protein RecA [Clostridia bacterium]
KNKVAPPFKEAEFDLMFGQGISKEGELLDIGVKLDLVQKSGSWFNMGEMRLGQGKDNAKLFLKNNPDIALGLEEEVHRKMGELRAAKNAGKKEAAPKAADAKAAKSAAPSAAPVLVEDFEE